MYLDQRSLPSYVFSGLYAGFHVGSDKIKGDEKKGWVNLA